MSPRHATHKKTVVLAEQCYVTHESSILRIEYLRILVGGFAHAPFPFLLVFDVVSPIASDSFASMSNSTTQRRNEISSFAKRNDTNSTWLDTRARMNSIPHFF